MNSQNIDDHDIKSNLSALQNGLNLITEEWKTNPELVERILPLMVEKILELKLNFETLKNRN